MVTPLLFIALGIFFLLYNNVFSHKGSHFYLFGTSIDFGLVLLIIGIVQLLFRIKRMRR
ncbi:MAG: hypothetical protein GXP49_00185 [Deltaproteobacteria bacterium]|nr:hypothetical protein [Deltaproteobacteria bacterium]